MDKIVLYNVNKYLKKKQVLKDINLELSRGKIYAFLGRNGSGKTMMLRVVAGLILPDTGYVEVFGQKISQKKLFPQNLGLMIENIGLWDHLSGMENLMLLAGIKKVTNEEGARRAMTRVGLEPDDTRKYKAYSLGMKQKLVLAQAIMEEPELLILDEPSNGLDDDTVEQFRTIMREEKARGCTILIATHQKEDIKGLADEYYEMKDGRCILQSEEMLS